MVRTYSTVCVYMYYCFLAYIHTSLLFMLHLLQFLFTYVFTPGTYHQTYHSVLFMDIIKRCIQEGKIFCTYSHTMRPEGASNEAINTSSIEVIMKQQWYIKFVITVDQELDVIIKAPEF